MLTIPAFGSLFLPLSLFVFLFRRSWLLPLLCVAAVLQSPSVLNVGWAQKAYGVTPFLWVSGLVMVDWLLRVRKRGTLEFGVGTQRRLLLMWLSYVGVCLLGALILPWLFAGAAVYAPLAKAGVQATPVVLGWSINHAAQVVNLSLIAVAMLWVVQQADDRALPRRMLLGVVAALAVSALIGFQQRLGWNGLVPMGDTFWASNPTYAQNYRSWAGVVPRVSWPLVEAAYGSVWYAAMFGGFAALFMSNLNRNRALLGALLALFALGNSLGANGFLASLIAVVLTLVVALLLVVVRPQWRGGLLYRLTLAALVGACLLLAVHLVLRHYGLIDEAYQALSRTWARWLKAWSGGSRSQADAHALMLARDTWGLGVGMGSNRASSYLTTLLGNTGLLGLSLFVLALVYQFKLLIGLWRQQHSASAAFFFGSGLIGLMAVSLGIPDQNWPVLWILILGGLVCVRDVDSAREEAIDPAQVTR